VAPHKPPNIYNRLRKSDYAPDAVKQFEKGSIQCAYNSNKWRPIAYAFYDVCGEHGRNWRRVERAAFQLGRNEIMDVYEALWGLLKDLPNNADEEARIEY